LYMDSVPCSSCARAINIFMEKCKNTTIEVIHNAGEAFYNNQGAMALKNYKFQELISIIEEVFSDFRREAAKIGEGNMQALSRFFVDYDCVIKEGACEAATVCSTLCIELSAIQEKAISRRHHDKLIGVLKQYDSSKIAGAISENEVELLNKQVEKAIQILEGMKVMD
jgi:flagellin-specific chaperone FliS